MTTTPSRPRAKTLVVCIDNGGYDVSLEKRKFYVALPDSKAERQGLLRVVDESGEDYLYPKNLFRTVSLPAAIKRALLAAA